MDDAACDEALSSVDSTIDFGFLPQSLRNQCRGLIESYHGLHGFGCLPDMLWRAGLGPFIETHQDLRQLLRKASITRSAKKSQEGFTQITTTLLSLEILSRNFADWGTLHPRAASIAKAILKKKAPHFRTPLMESYLYPPKQLGPAAIAMLALPNKQKNAEMELRSAR